MIHFLSQIGPNFKESNFSILNFFNVICLNFQKTVLGIVYLPKQHLLLNSCVSFYFFNHFFLYFRVHACLYFITPNGHGLKSIDLVCMKKLDSKVNIIPIIAKADTINKAELAKFKTKIMSELINNGVQIYQFPTGE